jgi:hypothetical protein
MAFIKSRCRDKRVLKQAKRTGNPLQSNHAKGLPRLFSRRKLRTTVQSRPTIKPCWTKCRLSRLSILIFFFIITFSILFKQLLYIFFGLIFSTVFLGPSRENTMQCGFLKHAKYEIIEPDRFLKTK